METINVLREYLTELREQLSGARFEQIDFDMVNQKLGDVDELLGECQVQAEEMKALRADYIERITRMLKGIEAVSRDRRRTGAVTAQTEGLSSMSGEDLVECYCRVSGQFRDAFPTSFNSGNNRTTVLSGAEEINAYK